MTELTITSVSKVSVNVLYDAKSRSSFCWKYFGQLILTSEGNKKKIIDPDQVYCMACLNAVKRESEDIKFGSVKIKSYRKTVSTGNLTRHLRDDHQIRDELTDAERASMKSYFTVKRPAKKRTSKSSTNTLSRHDKWLLAKDLVVWFCKSLIPFESVSDEGMVDFFKKRNIIVNDSDIPSRYTVCGSALSDVYESTLGKVNEIISSHGAQHFAITFDLWTDQSRRINYITFTLHYLTSDFNLRTFILSTEIIMGKNTEAKIKGRIDDIKKRFYLDWKNIVAVIDSGENVKRAVSMANMSHHFCLGHALHKLVIVDGLKSVPEVAEVVQKCKNVLMAIRYCTPELQIGAEKLQLEFLDTLNRVVEMLDRDEADPIHEDDMKTGVGDEIENENLPSLLKLGLEQLPTIKYTTPTRWHSVLEMLETVIHVCNRESINNMLRKIDQEMLRITQNEWMLLEDLVKFLKSFREAVQILSSQKTCTMNVALVFRSEIIDILNSIQDDESLIILRIKRNMLANINKRFPVSKSIVAAALLDNRFMTLKEIDVYLESQNTNRTYFLSSYIKEVVDSNDMSDTDFFGTSAGTSHAVDTSLLHKLSKKHSNIYQGIQDDPIEQECWRYIAAADPKEPKDGDLLSYWNSKRNAFPKIAALAKALLCIPATCTPSERMFSVAGLTVTAKRSHLSPLRVNKIIFIHDNYKVCDYIKKE